MAETIIERDGLDSFRLGYEHVRLGSDGETGAGVYKSSHPLVDPISYGQGRKFAVACQSTGYVLQEWPLGRRTPPISANTAFRRTIGQMGNAAKAAKLMVEYRGKTQSVRDWCQELGLNVVTVMRRLEGYKCGADQAFAKERYRPLDRIAYKGSMDL